MFKPQMPHFVTGPFKPQDVFLGDQEYGLALDCLVKACTDLLILDTDTVGCRVFLGKRIVEPQPDWWYMGGRMKPGDTPEKSLVRLMKRELALDIPPEKFRPLNVHSYSWARRQQPPMDNGTCDLSAVYTLVLDKEVVNSIKFDEKEYSEMGWFSLDEIRERETFHPALRSSARDLQVRMQWDVLSAVVTTREGNDAEVTEAARALVAAARAGSAPS
eukprot:TRINITY_DN1976_c0_g1_i1.p1 TRINITY_DN1976_c0_g1~~TRINITY_DN1976_c0_g1_i1.p1  ORF type:complete len:217 (+),score=37.01 TRINITY_DN1976_c0_g1_i1:339-989(+)